MPMPVTLQVSLAPTELRTARHVVPHQLRQWAAQVNEILFTVDVHRSRSSSVETWRRQLPGLRRLIEEWCAAYPHARSVDVDYRSGTMTEIAAAFFGGQPVPAKDYLRDRARAGANARIARIRAQDASLFRWIRA
jgi:hypothetical protein